MNCITYANLAVFFHARLHQFMHNAYHVLHVIKESIFGLSFCDPALMCSTSSTTERTTWHCSYDDDTRFLVLYSVCQNWCKCGIWTPSTTIAGTSLLPVWSAKFTLWFPGLWFSGKCWHVHCSCCAILNTGDMVNVQVRKKYWNVVDAAADCEKFWWIYPVFGHFAFCRHLYFHPLDKLFFIWN